MEVAVPAAAITASSSSSSHTSQHSENQDSAAATKHIWPTLENSQLFEGDLSIPQEMIDEYYGKGNPSKVHTY